MTIYEDHQNTINNTLDEKSIDKIKTPNNFNFRKLYQNSLTYLIFLAIAIVFWTLNILNNSFSTNLNIPVKYIHQLPGKRLVGDYPKTISINATAHGYVLLKHIIFSRQNPALISLVNSSLNEMPEKGINEYYLLTKNIKDKLQRQFPELILNYNSPDTLFFEMSDVIVQMKKVKPSVEIEYEQQYTLSNRIICVPDCVEITGPRSILDTLKYIETKVQVFKNLNKTTMVKLNLKAITDVIYNTSKVIVVVPINKYTESEIEIPVKALNVPSIYKMKTFPANIFVKYKITVDKYKYINSKQFEIVVDYNEISNSINNKIKLKLEKSPDYIWDISYKPKTVEFILERK